VRDCTVFAYSYPELVSRAEGESLVRRVNSLYGENATSQFTFTLGDPIRDGYTPRRAVQLADGVQRRASLQRGEFQYQYYANVRAQKSGMDGADGAYKVFVFLGRTRQLQDSMTPMDWLRDPSFVGFTGFQSSSTLNYGGYSGNPADGSGTQNANGVVALTKALEDRMAAGELSGLDEKTVGEYLNREMSWRISTVGCLLLLLLLSLLWVECMAGRQKLTMERFAGRRQVRAPRRCSGL
jgi:tyrosinase